MQTLTGEVVFDDSKFVKCPEPGSVCAQFILEGTDTTLNWKGKSILFNSPVLSFQVHITAYEIFYVK